MSVYTAPSQIAERQLASFAGKKVVIAGEAEDQFPKQLQQHAQSVTVFTSHYGYYQQMQRSGVDCQFGVEFNNNVEADLLLLYWPKAKSEAQYLLDMMLSKLAPETEVVVVGENRSGVKSIEKMFKDFGPINKYDSARRCSFYMGISQTPPAQFDLNRYFKSYQVELEGTSLEVQSLPGVFSHGEFDLGTKLLLANLPKLRGKVLDFGCGAGIIGAAMALRYPEIELEMCDVSAFAVESTKRTLQANGIKGHVFATDVYSQASSDYQFIISNPPFHSGLDTSYSATETLLQQAPAHLSRKGELVIVANSFLKYPPIIEKAFGQCVTVDKTNKFTIYSANK
ncbi:16S rRNA methyltransferase [Vibrio sp. UCD-FRSSP16_10]|uniref:16S rRNA (guanine(1207)-N(2))-methyltransferase RsmC n=1 Tax=unclassified Vibrio TaxID=2614977 RepID=UPI0007FE66CD|nr:MULTISPECIES: 16S rRNA (guanine(1207)-N(2))-methyltransferase RsmC [unclassified Vibrio]OBT17265.1 16S rRNA methyltransferase [Vibrio sp. UCD-FRSSP16_30]OBT23034.1 16S rRNA methyltransferase [Vibrio sp. UCD-FRSSP16_10]